MKNKKICTVHIELLYILHFQLIQVFYPSDFFIQYNICILHNKQLLNEDISLDLLIYYKEYSWTGKGFILKNLLLGSFRKLTIIITYLFFEF